MLMLIDCPGTQNRKPALYPPELRGLHLMSTCLPAPVFASAGVQANTQAPKAAHSGVPTAGLKPGSHLRPAYESQ